MPAQAPHIAVQRAKKVFTPDGRELTLKNCFKCKKDFYAGTKQTKCESCRKRRKCLIQPRFRVSPYKNITKAISASPLRGACKAFYRRNSNSARAEETSRYAASQSCQNLKNTLFSFPLTRDL